MSNSPRWLDWSFRAGLALAVCGAAWTVVPAQDADPSYLPSVRSPAYGPRSARLPRVIIDEAHYNTHTLGGRFEPFARLLHRDGYWVRRGDAPFSAASLRGADVLVVANALGFAGVVQQGLQVLRLERLARGRAGAFGEAEVAAVEAWVRGGGRLLLVADHAPAGAAASGLAAAFGVAMRGWWVEDAREGRHDPETGNPAFLLFSRDNGLLGAHAILEGRDPSERVESVITFTGQALSVPPGGRGLLTLSDSAREYPYRRSRESESRSAAGLAQAVALVHGSGRVIVCGEAGALTAQVARAPDGRVFRFGLHRAGASNEQLVLNMLHWLSGAL